MTPRALKQRREGHFRQGWLGGDENTCSPLLSRGASAEQRDCCPRQTIPQPPLPRRWAPTRGRTDPAPRSRLTPLSLPQALGGGGGGSEKVWRLLRLCTPGEFSLLLRLPSGSVGAGVGPSRRTNAAAASLEEAQADGGSRREASCPLCPFQRHFLGGTASPPSPSPYGRSPVSPSWGTVPLLGGLGGGVTLRLHPDDPPSPSAARGGDNGGAEPSQAGCRQAGGDPRRAVLVPQTGRGGEGRADSLPPFPTRARWGN